MPGANPNGEQLDIVTGASIALIECYAEQLKTHQDWADALLTITDARFELEILEEHHVTRARAQGASWGEVARGLNMTRQGAWKKHAAREL